MHSIAPACVHRVLAQIMGILTSEMFEELTKAEEMSTEGKLYVCGGRGRCVGVVNCGRGLFLRLSLK